MTNFPIIVCDDDQDLANQLAQNINVSIQNLTDDNLSYGKLNEKVTFIANDFAQTVGYIVANDIKNGIYFLDIELSRESKAKNGVDLAEFVKKQDENAQIIFVTAYDKYAPLTYRRRIGAIDYISKSLSQVETIHRLEETLRNAFDNLSSVGRYGKHDFTYKMGRRVFKVSENEVVFIENSVTQHKVHMVTEHGETEFRGALNQIETKAPFLIRVSQSYLINPERISSINPRTQTITFDNNMSIIYSRRYKKIVQEKIIDKFEDISID